MGNPIEMMFVFCETHGIEAETGMVEPMRKALDLGLVEFGTEAFLIPHPA